MWEAAWLPRPSEGIADRTQGMTIDIVAPGHALHSVIRPAALLPQEMAAQDPFALALRKIEFESAFINSTATGVGLASASSTRWGGTVGVGGEYGFAPNWSVGLEYDHLFMGDANNTFSVANPLLAGAANRISQDVDMVTLPFNYRFGGYGAPVTARY
jgi:hypothetical protein